SCRLAAALLEADAVAHLAADAAAALARDEVRGGARGDAAGLEDDDLPVTGQAGIDQRGRDARRLARARGGTQDQTARAAERADDLGQQRVDGKRPHGHAMPGRGADINRGRSLSERAGVRLAGPAREAGFAP